MKRGRQPVNWPLSKTPCACPLPGSACFHAREGAITNLINQLVEPIIVPLAQSYEYPRLTMRPEANCKRYETLYMRHEVAV